MSLGVYGGTQEAPEACPGVSSEETDSGVKVNIFGSTTKSLHSWLFAISSKMLQGQSSQFIIGENVEKELKRPAFEGVVEMLSLGYRCVRILYQL